MGCMGAYKLDALIHELVVGLFVALGRMLPRRLFKASFPALQPKFIVVQYFNVVDVEPCAEVDSGSLNKTTNLIHHHLGTKPSKLDFLKE